MLGFLIPIISISMLGSGFLLSMGDSCILESLLLGFSIDQVEFRSVEDGHSVSSPYFQNQGT